MDEAYMEALEDEESLINANQPINVEHDLEHFRQQWRDELGDRGSSNSREHLQTAVHSLPTREEEARYLFLQGVSAEQSGKLYDAIQYYRRAVQMVPDIEFKIDEFKPRRTAGRNDSESSTASNDEREIEDLLERFQRQCLEDTDGLCKPGFQQNNSHLSSLPVELMMYIIKWVISPDLDILSLENLSMVCRGLYVCARDEELWKIICQKIWGMNIGRPKLYGSYRNMYVQRPHLLYNGCYISRSEYYRQGEKSLDNYYRPFHLVEYFRYVRFFPDGQVLMLTSPDDPSSALCKLKSRFSKVPGILHGYYKMAGDQVTAVLRRRQVVDHTPVVYRYKGRRRNQNDNQDTGDNSFHVEFMLTKSRRGPHSQLTWSHYSAHVVYRSGQETVTDFELNKKSYPPLLFSRVKNYTSMTDAPLK